LLFQGRLAVWVRGRRSFGCARSSISAKMVLMTNQEIGFGSMRESNSVAHECGGSSGNFSGDGSFSYGSFCGSR
jgi:hypothetical protein